MSLGTCTVRVAIDPAVSHMVRRVGHVMYLAHLDDALEAIEQRVLLSKRMLEVELAGGRVTARLAPFAELALREAMAIARSHLDEATKTARVKAMLTLSGF